MKTQSWSRMFFAAALFNFAIAFPLILATRWTYDLAFITEPGVHSSNALRLWSDFGFCVFFIGVGYYIVSRNVSKNHGLVWLGIFSKIFDVVILTSRFFENVANWIVLVPAAIDGLFVIFFAFFLWKYRAENSKVASKTPPFPGI